MADQQYIFQKAEDQAEFERLRLIEKAFDAYTQKHLNRINLRAGSHCLEIGPGAGGIMRWLCERVGPRGHVTALDLDTRFVAKHDLNNLTVVQGDASKIDLGCDKYDIVHARYVFIHVYDYEKTLRKTYDALKPGGWLLLEEPDFNYARAETDDPELNQSFMNVREAIKRMYDAMKLDPAFGGKLTNLFNKSGFVNIDTDIATDLSMGQSAVAELMKRSTQHLKGKYLQTGAVDEKDIERYYQLADDQSRSAVYYGTVACWGQKP